jgi:hypothetical protein
VQTIHFALVFLAVMAIVMLFGTRIGRKMDRSWRSFAGLHGLNYQGAWYMLPSMAGAYRGVQVSLEHTKFMLSGRQRISLHMRAKPGLPPRSHFHVLSRMVPGLVIADQETLTGVAEIDERLRITGADLPAVKEMMRDPAVHQPMLRIMTRYAHEGWADEQEVYFRVFRLCSSAEELQRLLDDFTGLVTTLGRRTGHGEQRGFRT